MVYEDAEMGAGAPDFQPRFFGRQLRGPHRQVGRYIALSLGALAALALLLAVIANIGTELLWFQALGFSQVMRTQWITRILLFFTGLLIMGGSIALSLKVARNNRADYRISDEATPIDSLDPEAGLGNHSIIARESYGTQAGGATPRALMFAVPLAAGVLGGFAVASHWRIVQLALHAVPFGITDPQFGLDIGFFVFLLPLLRFVADFLLATIVLAGIAAFIFYYLTGGLRIWRFSQRVPTVTRGARLHLGSLAALALLVIAANYWLGRYGLLGAQGDKFDGASYAAIHAVLPGRTILAIVAALVAIVVLVAAVRDQLKVAGIAVGLLALSAVVLISIYPAIVQRFQVNPNAQELETPYIQRNIAATSAAFGLTGRLITAQYPAVTAAEPGALRQDADTTASIRLLDPAIVAPSFRQLQQNKQYYDFPNHLSVDRYTIAGRSRDTVIAVRELNLDGLGAVQRNWVNDHTVFTHGYGVVAAYGNQTGIDGRPAFFEGGIPTSGQLTDSQHYEPRSYFSPNLSEYSIVGAPAGVVPWELDYQTDEMAGGGQVTTAFPTTEVVAGPAINSWWRKLLFALRFGDEQLLFSDRVTDVSQIMFIRDPVTRVAKVAPWLTLDDRVYPAVVDGRVKWIIDGYTTADTYPYSELMPLEIERAYLNVDGRQALSYPIPVSVNYIRNSVKATVDAYDGSVTLYAWEPSDPVLQAWSRVFDNSITPMSEISGDLMSHLRYPEDLFQLQRMLLQRYHVTDAAAFFSGQDFWQIPADPTIIGEQIRPLQPPYYLTLKMPGQEYPEFSLSTLYVPGGNSDREILTAFLAVDSEAGNLPGVKSADYGVIRLLEMPRDITVPGPGQVQTNFVTNPAISQQLNVLEIGSSVVIRGNQLTLPVGGGLLYVQPVYVQSAEGTQFPLLRKVMVAFGDSIGFADTLTGALDQVFGEGAADGLPGASAVAPGSSATATAPQATLPGSQPTMPAPQPTEPGSQPTVPAPQATEPAPPATAASPAPVPTATALPPTAPPFDNPQADLAVALADAQAAWDAGELALQAGDFAAYGAAQARLHQALERAFAAHAALTHAGGEGE